MEKALSQTPEVNLIEIIISKPERAFEGPSSITDIRHKVCKLKVKNVKYF